MKENKRRRHILSCCQAGLRTSVDNNKKQNLFSGGGEEGGGGGHSSNLIYVKYLPAGNSVDTQLKRERASFFPFFHGIENMSIVGCGLKLLWNFRRSLVGSSLHNNSSSSSAGIIILFILSWIICSGLAQREKILHLCDLPSCFLSL